MAHKKTPKMICHALFSDQLAECRRAGSWATNRRKPNPWLSLEEGQQ